MAVAHASVGAHRRVTPRARAASVPHRLRVGASARPGERPAQGGAGPRVAAGRRRPAGCAHDPQSTDRPGPFGQCLSRGSDRGRRRVFGDRSHRRKPGTVGGAAGRPHVLCTVRRVRTATARRRSRRGERRGVGGVGKEPARTPTRCRRGVRGTGTAVRRTGDLGRTEVEQDGCRVAPLHPDQRSPA